MKRKPKTQNHKTSPANNWFRTLILSGVILILTSCHFPQPKPNHISRSNQRQTETAGILNPFGLETPTPTPDLPRFTPSIPTLEYVDGTIIYTTQQGDTLDALARRFGVDENDVLSETPLPEWGLLPIGIQIRVPNVLEETLIDQIPILPDSEVVYGPSVGDFNAADYAAQAGGFLASYAEDVKGERLTGPQIIHWVAIETSSNPRLLLAFLEYRSGWVYSHPPGAANDPYPLGFGAAADTGLYKELMITAKLLAQGYYGWREGSLLELNFRDGERTRLSPGLNAGSTALMHLFATVYSGEAWESHLFGESSFLDFYQGLYGDPWARAAIVEPYLLSTIRQPELTLPFTAGEDWRLTGGPHITWQTGTPRGALDFAPVTGEPVCAVSTRWVTASASGLVIRSDRGVVAIDLDGDGDEGTGWVLVYLHIAEQGRAPLGAWLEQDAPIGHPSCEGGQASGTHVHIARKFYGEWLGVSEPFPLILSGWQAFAGSGRYAGILLKGDAIVTSHPDGAGTSLIIRED